MSHKFAVGQVVMFTPDAGEVGINSLPTMATVTRLLPMEGGENQYHVKVDADGLQRRVRENQLRSDDCRRQPGSRFECHPLDGGRLI
jgi:hypothetical protein